MGTVFSQHRTSRKRIRPNHRVACGRRNKTAGIESILYQVFEGALPFVKDPQKFIHTIKRYLPRWVDIWTYEGLVLEDVTVFPGQFEFSREIQRREWIGPAPKNGSYIVTAGRVHFMASATLPLPPSREATAFVNFFEPLIQDKRGFINALRGLRKNKMALGLLGKLLKKGFLEYAQDMGEGTEWLYDPKTIKIVRETEEAGWDVQYLPSDVSYGHYIWGLESEGIKFWIHGDFEANPIRTRYIGNR